MGKATLGAALGHTARPPRRTGEQIIRKDVAEVLALLSPGAQRLDFGGSGGSGGIGGPEVAHALATVSDPLGREVLLLRGNPDAGALCRFERLRLMYDTLTAEAERRLTEALKLRIRGRRDWDDVFPVPEPARADELCPRYERLVSICSAELSGSRICTWCAGRGCDHCHGSGLETMPDRRWSARRCGELMGINESSWRRTWASPYDWLFNTCEEAEVEAKRQLAHALSSKLRGAAFS